MNNPVYIYQSRLDGTFFAQTNSMSKEKISRNIFDGKDMPVCIIRNKENLRDFLKDWEDIFDEFYLKTFSRIIRDLLYNENKAMKEKTHGTII